MSEGRELAAWIADRARCEVSPRGKTFPAACDCWVCQAYRLSVAILATPPPEAAEETAVSYDELTAAYRDQVAHTDLVRAEYQRRLTLAEARAQIAEGESAADLDTLGKVLARVRALEAALGEMNEIIEEPGTPPKSVLRDWQQRHRALLAKATP